MNAEEGQWYGTEEIAAWRCAEGCPVAELDRQSGEQKSGVAIQRHGGGRAIFGGMTENEGDGPAPDVGYGDTGGASRFVKTVGFSIIDEWPPSESTEASKTHGATSERQMPITVPIESGTEPRFRYQAKASRSERNAGLGGFEDQNNHPTVKPIALMRWLCRLVTPPEGLILDPFTGSGTTGIAAVLEDFNFIGIEKELDYAEIARARIAHWAAQPKQLGLLA